jgi:hypothetical protein
MFVVNMKARVRIMSDCKQNIDISGLVNIKIESSYERLWVLIEKTATLRGVFTLMHFLEVLLMQVSSMEETKNYCSATGSALQKPFLNYSQSMCWCREEIQKIRNINTEEEVLSFINHDLFAEFNKLIECQLLPPALFKMLTIAIDIIRRAENSRGYNEEIYKIFSKILVYLISCRDYCSEVFGCICDRALV